MFGRKDHGLANAIASIAEAQRVEPITLPEAHALVADALERAAGCVEGLCFAFEGNDMCREVNASLRKAANYIRDMIPSDHAAIRAMMGGEA